MRQAIFLAAKMEELLGRSEVLLSAVPKNEDSSMMTDRTLLVNALTYAGALPFAAMLLAVLLGVNNLPLLGSPTEVSLIYGAVIASFLAGSHWGIFIAFGDKIGSAVAIISNCAAILIWISVLIFPDVLSLSVLALVFAGLLLVDFKLAKAAAIAQGYLTLRIRITSLVVLLLIGHVWVL